MPHISFIVTSQSPLPGTIRGATVAPQEASALVYLRGIVAWDGKHEGTDKMLTSAFEAKDYLHCVKNLQATDIDPQSYINCLDQVSLHFVGMRHVHFITTRWQIIDTLSTDSNLWKLCVRSLAGACGLHGLLPASHGIAFTLTEPHGRPISSGSYFNHWKLTHRDDHDQVFAVKSFCAYARSNAEDIKKVRGETRVIGQRLTAVAYPEILRRCYIFKANEPPQPLVHRRRSPASIQALHGV